ERSGQGGGRPARGSSVERTCEPQRKRNRTSLPRVGDQPIYAASLRKVRTANLSDLPKPAIRREEIFASSGGVLRGRRGQRAGKVGLGRLGDPGHRHRSERCESGSESISCRLEAGKSERPPSAALRAGSVARKSRSSRDGAKGPWQEPNGLKKSGG